MVSGFIPCCDNSKLPPLVRCKIKLHFTCTAKTSLLDQVVRAKLDAHTMYDIPEAGELLATSARTQN